jgi:Tfp pilus assembly protein PilV
MKILVAVLVLAVALLGYRLLKLEAEVAQLQTNTAIAVLSAEAANNKVGAIAPFFAQDKEAFAKAWLDSVNMPGAVFPEDVLIPLKRTLEQRRESKESREMKAATFK